MPHLAPSPIPQSAMPRSARLDADTLQDLADLGMSRRHISELVGVCRPVVNRWLRDLSISTNGHAHRKGDEIHGCRGKQPAKLLPSAEALRAVSIFSMGFDSHDRSVFSAANRVTPNQP